MSVTNQERVVAFRPATPADDDFLYELYRSTRTEDLGAVELHSDQLELITRMQFNAQRQQYASDFPDADHEIILVNNKSIGRSIVDRTTERILLVDLAILTEYRNAGIGTIVVKRVQAEARVSGRPLRITVEKTHPVLPHWERMGFKRIAATAINFYLEWTP